MDRPKELPEVKLLKKTLALYVTVILIIFALALIFIESARAFGQWFAQYRVVSTVLQTAAPASDTETLAAALKNRVSGELTSRHFQNVRVDVQISNGLAPEPVRLTACAEYKSRLLAFLKHTRFFPKNHICATASEYLPDLPAGNTTDSLSVEASALSVSFPDNKTAPTGPEPAPALIPDNGPSASQTNENSPDANSTAMGE